LASAGIVKTQAYRRFMSLGPMKAVPCLAVRRLRALSN
jgi:hypothetical protein